MTECFIYCLLDENECPFYIGATKNVDKRRKSHVSEAKLYLKVGERNWVNDKIRKIADLILNGIPLKILILEQCDISKGDERECFYYNQMSGRFTLLQKSPELRRYTHSYKYKH